MKPLPWLFVLATLISLDARIIAPVLPAIAATLAVMPGDVGYAMTAYTAAYGLLQLVYGPLSDRYGRIRVVRLTALLFALATAASGFAVSILGFVGARLVTGAVAAATIPTTFAYIGDTVPYAGRHRTVALFGTVMSGAQALSAALAGTVTHVVSWRVMFGAYAVLTLVPATALWWAGEAPRASARPQRVSYTAILALAVARRVYVAAFAEGFFVWGGTIYLGVLIKQRFGFNELQMGLLLACYGIGTLLGGFSVSWIAPVVGERALASRGGLLQAAAWLLLAPALPWPFFATSLVVLGAGLAWLHSTLQTRATELLPEARGKAFALFPLSYFMGGAAGAAALGRLVDAGLFWALIVACGLGLGAVGQYVARRS